MAIDVAPIYYIEAIKFYKILKVYVVYVR